MLKEELPHHHKEGKKTSGIKEQLSNIEDFRNGLEILNIT